MAQPPPPGVPVGGSAAWGQGAPPYPGARPGQPPRLTAATLISHVVALVIGFIAAIGVWVTHGEELRSGFFGDIVIPEIAALAIIAATVAALASWGEIDLSFIGMFAVGAHVYVEVSESNTALGLLAAGAVGLFVGAVVGLLRWGTQAPSPHLTLGVGLFALFAVQAVQGNVGRPFLDTERIEGSVVPLAVAVVMVGVSVGVALLGKAPPADDGRGGGAPSFGKPGRAGPEVVAGLAVSGLGGALAGALVAARTGGVAAMPGGLPSITLVLLVIAALAFAGVRWGSWLVAPLAAAVASVPVTLITFGADLHGLDPAEGYLIIAGVAVVCLVASYGLHRILSSTSSRPTVPPPGGQWAPAGSSGQAPAPAGPAGQPLVPPAPPAEPPPNPF